MRRVVVTGMGCVSPLGLNFPTTWRNLLAGQCGVKPLSESASFGSCIRGESGSWQAMSCQVAAPVPCGGDAEWQPTTRVTRYSRFALAASEEALADAGLADLSDDERDMTGVCIGVGIASLEDIASCARSLENGKPKEVSPFFVPKILGNSPAGQIAIRHQLRGPCHSASTACATGAHSIGDAARFIQHGDADVMVAGGTEACINPIAFVGFQRLRALTVKHNDNPAGSSRPFDEGRAGFVMGEGAAFLVLEERERALARGATPYAELVGYGATGDAHHVTAPETEGRGCTRAMQRALRQAADFHSVADPLSELQYVNAHATSTPLGDEIEARAIDRVASTGGRPVRVSSTKGAVGHLLGAAGAIEAAFTVAAIRDRVAPVSLNIDEPVAPDAAHIRLVRGASAELPKEQLMAMSNSFGFGGTNSCLLFRSC